MGRAANPEADCWFGIQDPRKRKQIQDRLAQRARRKRLAESKKFSSSSTTGSDAGDSSSTSGGGVKLARGEQCSPYRVPSVPRSPGSYYQALVPTSQPERYVTGQLPGSVYAALFNNGSMMGLACSATVPDTSRPTGSDIPESLHPTKLQLTTIHPLWIDRFPFPKMRDNMITLLGIINEEEFLSDLFCLTSFSLEPGAPPWDPAAWKIGREFSEKWGYLFY